MTSFERERLFRRRRKSQKNNSLVSTTTEYYSIAYYLYCAIQAKPFDRIPDEAICLFMQCVEHLNLTEKASKILSKTIQNLVDKKRLNPLAPRIIRQKNRTVINDCDSINSCEEQEQFEEYEELIMFDDSNVCYEFEEDKRIDRSIRYDGNIDQNVINLYRCINTADKPIFCDIIARTFFLESEIKSESEITASGEVSDNIVDLIKNTEASEISNETPVYLDNKGNLKLSAKIRKYIEDVGAMSFLIQDVEITKLEARYLLLLYRLNTNYWLRQFARCFDECFHNCTAAILGTSEAELRNLLRADQKLKAFGFIDNSNDFNDDLVECIETGSIDPYFSDLLKPLNTEDAYELNSFSVDSECSSIMTELLDGKNPVSLLLYGKPGSGKTQYAKAVCKKSGLQTYIFKNELEAQSRSNPVYRLNCLLSLGKKDSVIIVDEADNLLKTQEFSMFGPTPTSKKGIVNKMLENSKQKVIWIINYQNQIDDSTRRRFTFSLKFESMPSTMLRNIADSKLKKLNISAETKEKLLNLFGLYNVTGASVDNIVKTIQGIKSDNEEEILTKAKTVIKENSLLLNGNSKMRDRVKETYDPTVINSSMPADKVVRMVENAVKFAEKNKSRENGIRILFYGLSGCGKTELARYIAEKLNKKILLKRGSDILSKYVGENEQNIKEAFDEAEATDQILLFDECDTFISDRADAKTEWQRSMVNEFLTQMEEFRGIMICTTNLRKILDPAMQRRFHILVEMKPMKYDGIKTMLKKFFGNYEFTSRQIEKLEDYESVTPGDFGSLSGRIRFQDEEDINAEYIFDELIKIQEEKLNNQNGCSRSMGFTA